MSEQKIKKPLKSVQKAKNDWPREKLLAKGASNLKDSELLAILLGTGYEGKNVLLLSDEILGKYPKAKLLSLPPPALAKIKGIGLAKATTIAAAFELSKRALNRESTLPRIISKKDVLAQTVYLREKQREHFMVLYLNGRGEMIYKKPMFVGTLNANLVHPREIFALALKLNAAAVIFAHNHPSGNAGPSQQDIVLTKRLVEAGKIMGVDVLEHIIVCAENSFSFKENNLI